MTSAMGLGEDWSREQKANLSAAAYEAQLALLKEIAHEVSESGHHERVRTLAEGLAYLRGQMATPKAGTVPR
jgi:hypothetical protein